MPNRHVLFFIALLGAGWTGATAHADGNADSSHRTLTLHLLSTHFGGGDYNEQNLGLGLRAGRNAWCAMAGFYKNSLDRNSVYAGAGWTLGRLGPAAIAVNAGAVSGYAESAVPFITPEFVMEFRGLQVLVTYLPKFETKHAKTAHTLALSLGATF